MKFIITADWHLRSDRPRCRLDGDWMETQRQAIQFVIHECRKHEMANLCIIGDIFHKPTDCINILNLFLDLILETSVHVGILAGNHDLLYGTHKYVDKCLYGILLKIMDKSINLHPLWIWGNSFDCNSQLFASEGRERIFLHALVFPSLQNLIPGTNSYLAEELLDIFPKAKWIFTGDNHHNFVYEKNKRYVINPGCLIRQTVDMKDYQPVIYFVDTEEEIIEEIKIPDANDIVTDEYITEKKERDQRIISFVESIKGKENISLSFIDNLKAKINKLDKDAQQIIIDLIGGN